MAIKCKFCGNELRRRKDTCFTDDCINRRKKIAEAKFFCGGTECGTLQHGTRGGRRIIRETKTQ